MDIARLGYEIDSSGLNVATRALDQNAEAAKKTQTATEKLEASYTRLVRQAGILVAATAAAGALALVNLGRQAIIAMDEMGKLSQAIGVNVQELSALSYAADSAGVSNYSFSSSMETLAKRASDAGMGLEEASRGFRALGISVKGADGTLKSTDKLLGEVASKFATFRDGTEKSAIAMNIFGRAGTDLIPLLNMGEAGIQRLTDEAKELGIAFDSDAASAASRFSETLAKLNAVKEALGNRIAVLLLPVLNSLSERFLGSAQSAEKLDKVARVAATGMKLIGSAGAIVVGIFKTVGEALGGVAAAVVAVFQGKFSEAWDITKNFSADIVGNIKGTVGNVAAIWDESASSASANANAVGEKLAAPLMVAEKKVRQARDRIGRALDQMAADIRRWSTELAGTNNRIMDDYARRLDEIQDKVARFARTGVPLDKIRDFEQQMTSLAEAIRDKDIAEYLRDFNHATEEMTAFMTPGADAALRYKDAIYQLNREMASGILTEEAYTRRVIALAKQHDSASIMLLRSMREEIDLLGKSANEQEIWNNLRAAGVTEESAYGQAIIETTRILQEYREAMADQVEAMDAVRDAGRNLLSDLASGGNPLQALEDALDRVNKRLLDMVSENFMDQLLGKRGDPGGGKFGDWLGGMFGGMFGVDQGAADEAARLSKAATELAASGTTLFGAATALSAAAAALATSGAFSAAATAGGSVTGAMGGGGGWSSLIGAVLGAGRENGGDVYPGLAHPVGEKNKPELLRMGQKLYLIPGDKGRVEPMPASGGDTYINVGVEGQVDRRSRSQIASDIGREIAKSRRNR